MHIDHDHIASGEHSHPHEHEHTHAHTHEHPHDHDHLHEDGSAHDHTHTPMEELLALMKYMVGHNAAHARELADLALLLVLCRRRRSLSEGHVRRC